MRRVAVIEDERCELHQAPPGHPEAPARLHAVRRAIETAARQNEGLSLRGARPAENHELLAVHPESHLRGIEAAARSGPTRIDPDTFASSASDEVARLAAGAAIDALGSVARGEADAALAAVRPPGHHAEADRAMGFCLFNNVAVAVRALRESEGLERVLILDWDVHHGNGTQHLFEAERDVFYASIHQYPFYPGTGAAGEIGVGPGEGSTLNVPLPEGCGDAVYENAMRRLIAPAAIAFQPQMIVVSCGFDAHRDDPLGGMRLSGSGYRAMTDQIRSLAETLCGGRLAFVLEGGYSAVGLEESTGSLLESVLEDSVTAGELSSLPREHPFWTVVEALDRAHGGAIPRLGADH